MIEGTVHKYPRTLNCVMRGGEPMTGDVELKEESKVVGVADLTEPSAFRGAGLQVVETLRKMWKAV